MEPQIQLPMDLHQRRPVHGGIQERDQETLESRDQVRDHPERALGHPKLDQQGHDERERKATGRAERTIRELAELPPNVSLEQRLVLQAPGAARHAVLLAC